MARRPSRAAPATTGAGGVGMGMGMGVGVPDRAVTVPRGPGALVEEGHGTDFVATGQVSMVQQAGEGGSRAYRRQRARAVGDGHGGGLGDDVGVGAEAQRGRARAVRRQDVHDRGRVRDVGQDGHVRREARRLGRHGGGGGQAEEGGGGELHSDVVGATAAVVVVVRGACAYLSICLVSVRIEEGVKRRAVCWPVMVVVMVVMVMTLLLLVVKSVRSAKRRETSGGASDWVRGAVEAGERREQYKKAGKRRGEEVRHVASGPRTIKHQNIIGA